MTMKMTMLSDESAGHFAFESSALTDPSKQNEVYKYLECLKKDDNGWKRSLESIINKSVSSPEEHFLLLQVVEDFVKRRYQHALPADVSIIRAFLGNWMERVTSGELLVPFLVNKMAHIFSLVFAADFPLRWPNFMQEVFLQRGFSHLPTVVFYLKTLLAIDQEVVNREIERSKEIFDRNTKIKDLMRELCMKECASSWCEILETATDPVARSLVLDVVAAYVDWVDVELVANERFVSLLVRELADTSTVESAIRTVEGVVQKGMPAQKKLTLTVALLEVINGNRLIAVSETSDDDDVDRAGSLISVIGHQLIDVHSRIEKEGGSTADAVKCLLVIKQFVPTALRILENPDPELSELVIDFLRDFVFLIRDSNEPEQISVLANIVRLCLIRYAMPAELNPDGEGEDEIHFHEYRRQLRQLVHPIGVKRPQLVIEPLEGLVSGMHSAGGAMEVRRVEAIVLLVYSLAEMIPANFPLPSKDKDPWLARAAQLPLLLLEAVPLDGRSAQVHVQYFENACRYDKIVATSPDRVVRLVAAAFLDERGIAFPVEKVRTRIVYLFVRFVKAHKTLLSPLVSEVITRLAPLLAVSPQAGQGLSFDDQAFLYEATGTLIIFGKLEPQQKRQYIEELAGTLASRFSAGLSELDEARRRGDKAAVQASGLFLSALVGYASRLSKAFTKEVTMAQNMCVEIFLKLLNLFLSALCPGNSFLLESVRQLSHRIVVCLDKEALEALPLILSKLGECSQELDSMNHLLILCHQIVAKHGKAVMSSGVDFGAILSNAARFSADPEVQTKFPQDEANKRALLYCQRAFCQFLYSVVSCEMLTDLAPGDSADLVVEAARRLCYLPDSACQKHCLMSLTKIAVLSVTKNGGRWFEAIVRTVLEVPALPHVSIIDAGSQQVMHECSNSLMGMRAVATQPFDAVVTSLLPEQMAKDLLTILSSMKGKELDKSLNILYDPVRQKPKTS